MPPPEPALPAPVSPFKPVHAGLYPREGGVALEPLLAASGEGIGGGPSILSNRGAPGGFVAAPYHVLASEIYVTILRGYTTSPPNELPDRPVRAG